MKQKTRKRIQGSISVLLIIILLPTMVLSALIVDTSRTNMARSMVSGAGDLAINSALADYDTILKDVYGLFAMSQAKTNEQLAAEIKEYFEDTLVSYGVTSEAEAGNYVDMVMGNFNELVSGTGSMEVSNFLNMEVASDFVVNKEAESGLDNPQILRKQIVDYMKYRAPVNFGLSFLDSVKAFTTVSDQSKVVLAQVGAQESLQPVTGGCRTVIDGIRAFDKTVLAINGGTQAVTGLTSSTDPEVVPIEKYHEQVDKYKAVWGENYRNINELNLIFLIKSPEVTDKYLSKMNYSANELLIGGDVNTAAMHTDNSGITVETTLADSYEAAAAQVQQQRDKLAGEPYHTLQANYRDTSFLDRLNLDTNKTAFAKREEAIAAFIQFEALLCNDTAKTSITYNEVKDTLEQLYILEKYQGNYMNLLGNAITEKKTERDQKKTELDNKGNEVNAARTALENGKEAKEAVQTTKKAWEDAESALSQAQTDLDDAKDALDAYTGKTNTTTYKNLKKDVESAQAAYDDAEEAEEDAKEAYEAAVAAAPSDEKIAQLEAALKARELEYGTLNAEYERLKQAVESLESIRNLAVNDYKNSISQYKAFTDAYQHDLELYEDYKSVAKQLIAKDAKAVKEQYLKIQGNIQKLSDDLKKIYDDLIMLNEAIVVYGHKVDAWEEANNNYVSANSADSFSKQNAADIASTDSQYNIDSLQRLLDYVKVLEQEYRNFYEYITDENYYKYGTAGIGTLESSEQVLSAVPEGIRTALPEIVTPEAAGGQLDSLYPSQTTPSIEIEKLTFVTDGVLPIQFLKYLNENFPEEEKNLTLKTEDDGSASDPKKEYDNLKGQMKEDKEGQEKIDSVDGNEYGYTFQTKGKLDKSKLPSNGKAQKEAGSESVSISEDSKGAINASDSLGKQGENLDNVLGNVGNVLEAGLENIYLVDYIFQNFSYNTLVQEQLVEGENLTTYPQVMALKSNAKLGDYRGSAKTLSNYNITGANNYLYGGEVEYILFGNKSPKTNVTYTKGSIYAIRFAFNCIFAFTDSEIRNTAMAAGLAVQAATMGFVPYQLVQAVLQLALAAAESAVDLDMMSKGLKVVVVKTRDTWSMSVSGAVGMLTDAAAAMAEEKISEAIGNAVEKVNEGINTVMEASAEELSGAVTSLADTVNNAAQSKGQEIVDGVFTELQSKIDELLNELQFVKFSELSEDGTTIVMTRAEVNGKIDAMFQELRSSVDGIVASYAGNPIGDAVMGEVSRKINDVISDVQTQINGIVSDAFLEAPPDVGGAICEAMLQIKYNVINIMQDSMNDLTDTIKRKVPESIAGLKEELKTYAQDCVTEAGEELTETAAAEVKKQITDSLNRFSNTYLKDAGKPEVNLGTGGTGAGKTTSPKVASMIKFGYKDYLMLLMFISVCVNDDAVLGRTADMIQLNLQNATGTPDKEGQVVFQHQKGKEFTLGEAKTYVSVQGSVKLDMLFLDMDFFNNLLKEDGADMGQQMDAVSTIQYKGVAGY